MKTYDDLKLENERLRSAMQLAITALDDWVNSFAPDFCGSDRVFEAQKRLNENGTLWYIATTLDACTNSLR